MLRPLPAPRPFLRRLLGERRPGRGALALAAAAGLCVLGGCPDPEAKFEEFIDNTDDDRDFVPPMPDIAAMEADISGQFLFASSTIIAPDNPLQFISTNTITVDEMGRTFLTAELQPLSLDQFKVTTPRLPVGDPISNGDMIEIVDGAFVIDAGTVNIPGEANPLTGSPIVATLTMTATIVSEDFYCGTITGEVMEPLQQDLAGSTFAAVRIEGPMALPLDVTKNCAGDTITDMMMP